MYDMSSEMKLISRLATTMASFSALLSFCGTPVASIESAFGYNVAAAGDWGCKETTKKL